MPCNLDRPLVGYFCFSPRDHANSRMASDTALNTLLMISTVESASNPPKVICEYLRPSISQSNTQMAVVQMMNVGGYPLESRTNARIIAPNAHHSTSQRRVPKGRDDCCCAGRFPMTSSPHTKAMTVMRYAIHCAVFRTITASNQPCLCYSVYSGVFGNKRVSIKNGKCASGVSRKTMLRSMSGEQGGSHIEVGILDNDACALQMISIVLRQRDAAIRIGWSDTNAQYTLERMIFGPISKTKMVDVIVLDLALNGISGVDVCRQIRLRNAKVGILGVSSYALDQYRCQLALAGAQGLFSKQEILSSNFVEAVRIAASGASVDTVGGFLSAEDAYTRLHVTASVPCLEVSARELEILGMYARGLTTKEIGGQLSISSATVLSHVNHAAQKLGVKKRVDAIRICRQRHLIQC